MWLGWSLPTHRDSRYISRPRREWRQRFRHPDTPGAPRTPRAFQCTCRYTRSLGTNPGGFPALPYRWHTGTSDPRLTGRQADGTGFCFSASHSRCSNCRGLPPRNRCPRCRCGFPSGSAPPPPHPRSECTGCQRAFAESPPPGQASTGPHGASTTGKEAHRDHARSRPGRSGTRHSRGCFRSCPDSRIAPPPSHSKRLRPPADPRPRKGRCWPPPRRWCCFPA